MESKKFRRSGFGIALFRGRRGLFLLLALFTVGLLAGCVDDVVDARSTMTNDCSDCIDDTGNDITPPADVTTFTATAGQGEVALSWANPGDTDFAGVMVRRDSADYPSSADIGTLAYNGAEEAFTDEGLTTNTVYYYTAFSFDAVGNYSAGAQAVTSGYSTENEITDLVIEAGDTSLTLSWNNPTDSEFAGVMIRRSSLEHPTSTVSGLLIYNDIGISWTDTGLTNGSTYFYTAFTYDTNSTSDYSIGTEASGRPIISTPTALDAAVVAAGRELSVSWDEVAGATGYFLYWSTTAPVTSTDNPTSVVGLSYAHTGLTDGTEIFYRISAVDSNSESDLSGEVGNTPADSVSPADVTGFSTVGESDQVVLSWSNPAGDFAGVIVCRDAVSTADPTCSGGTVAFDQAGTAGAADGFTDESLGKGVAYTYSAFATDAAVNYATGIESSVITPLDSPGNLATNFGDKEITLSWDSSVAADTYNLYWSTTSGVTQANGTELLGVTSPYTHPELTYGTTYYYVVTALNTITESGYSAEVSEIPREVIDVSGGDEHTVILKIDGTLWSWGANGSGQLGDGTTNDQLSPVQVGSDTDWSTVFGGYAHTVVLKSGGTLWAWGLNGDGQLGDGTTNDKLSPVQVGTDTDWIAVSGGYGHTVALKSDGTLWAWGYNRYGQLGDGTTVDKTSPVQVCAVHDGTSCTMFFDAGAVTAIASGDYHNFALKSDGTLWAWGDNGSGKLGDGTNVDKLLPVQVGTDTDWSTVGRAYSHSSAVKSDGTLWTWGANGSGQLGDGTTVSRSSPAQVGTDTDWIAAAGYWDHTAALKSDGTLWAWGGNYSGQLGDGTKVDKTSPVQVGTDTDWSKVETRGAGTIALKNNGEVWNFGDNSSGQLGEGSMVNPTSPVQVGSGTTWSVGHACSSYSVALKTDGTLWVWGYQSYGGLGLGDLTEPIITPVEMLPGTTWNTVACADHTVAVKSDGTLWAWGKNSNSQLGDGTTVSRSSPVQVLGWDGVNYDTDWSAVGVGMLHTLASKTDGTLWAWGWNGNGQLGDGAYVTKASPVQVCAAANCSTKFANATDFAGGISHSAALKSDGTIWAWGGNSSGEVTGYPLGTSYNFPRKIGSVTTWASLQVGCCGGTALKDDGTIWSLGGADNSVVQVGTDNTWIALAPVSSSHFAALKGDGTLWAWGNNTYGQLGDGTTVYRASPVKVGSDNTWEVVGALEYHTLAVKTDGTLWSWGRNQYGQLGFLSAYKPSPVRVIFP